MREDGGAAPRSPQLNFYRAVSHILKHRVHRVFFWFYLDPPGFECPPQRPPLFTLSPKIWGCQVSQLIVRFYVQSHATLLTFLKAVVWLKFGREDEATSVDVLRHLVAGNAQMRTMLSYFYIKSRARVDVELRGEQPSDSFVWKQFFFFFF